MLEVGQIPLSVPGTAREGVAALLQIGGTELWVGSVHLKAGCRTDAPEVSEREACHILAAQIPVLEAWIDARLAQGLILGGDFNRTFSGFNRFQPSEDPVWADLADGVPAQLLAFPFAPQVTCPEGRYGEATWPVDFVLASATLALRTAPGPYMQPQGGEALSDHCPVVVAFQF